jgi:hypothetical protein
LATAYLLSLTSRPAPTDEPTAADSGAIWRCTYAGIGGRTVVTERAAGTAAHGKQQALAQ